MHPRDGGPVAFAGLWEDWMGPNGEELQTACIITTAANRALMPLHDRMPAVIPPEAFDLWLDNANVDATTAAALLTPAPETLFEAYEVSNAVNRAENDSPNLIEPVAAAPPRAPTAAASGSASSPAAGEPTPKAATPKRKKDDGQLPLL